jgi:hypothetical protein
LTRLNGIRDRASRLDELLTWAMDHWDSPPLRVHTQRVWSGPEGGSHLGSPAWSDDYRRWMEDSPFAVMHEEQIGVHCVHPQQSEKDRKHGQRCPDCDETGLRDAHRLRYRWPLRAALAVVAKDNVPDDRPRLDSVIWQLAANEWAVGAAAAVLADRFPAMADPTIAAGWTLAALLRARAAYREDAPGRAVKFTEKSQAQQSAEAAA